MARIVDGEKSLSYLFITFQIISFSRFCNFVEDVSLCSFILIQGAFPFRGLKGFNTFYNTLFKTLLPWFFDCANSASVFLLKVNNRNTKRKCEICSKLTIKTPEGRVLGVVLVSLLLTLNIFHNLF